MQELGEDTHRNSSATHDIANSKTGDNRISQPSQSQHRTDDNNQSSATATVASRRRRKKK